MSQPSYYGYNLLVSNDGGLGAMVHGVMLAAHYAKYNRQKLVLVEEGKDIPLLNGNHRSPGNRNWDYYFSSLEYQPHSKVEAVWPSCPRGNNCSVPKFAPVQPRIEWYSKLLKEEIYLLNPEVQDDIDRRVARTGFNPTADIVLHIRRTDKMFGHNAESGELTIQVYFDETMKVIKDNNYQNIRIYVCTDDQEICSALRDMFKAEGIDLVWDQQESVQPLHVMKLKGELTREQTWEETLEAFKNIQIMAQAKHLIGGRMSYFFRIPELLRYPLPSTNIKDSDKFGIPPYIEPGTPLVRPMRPKRYIGCVSDQPRDWKAIQAKLEQERIVILPEIFNEETTNQLRWRMSEFKHDWWEIAVHPTVDGQMFHTRSDPKLNEYYNYVERQREAGYFSYRFKRTRLTHYETCVCFSCKLRDTFTSSEIMELLSNITGEKVIKINETFASLYEDQDFLTMHHDKNKGDYTFILNLSLDWKPEWGGITHFYDSSKRESYLKCVPTFNSLTVFKLKPDSTPNRDTPFGRTGQMDHWVTKVEGPHQRLAYTGWFNVEK